MLDPKIKTAIDKLNVEEMLRRMRYAPSNDPMLQGEACDYFHQEFVKKRSRLGTGEYVQISKRVTDQHDREQEAKRK